MARNSFKKLTAMILCAALIFQNSALTYGSSFERGEGDMPLVGSYEEGAATTESAIKVSTESAIQSIMAGSMEESDYDISWYNSLDKNFEIINGSQLRGLANLVNGTAVNTSGTAISADNFSTKAITLADNIDLENKDWIPIGTSSKQFMGSFDGGGYTVEGLHINTTGTNLGLFGYIGATAEIENLTVSGSVTETSAQGANATYIGGIVGYVNGAAKLTNLTNKADVSMKRNYAGGIAGYVNGAAEFEDCLNEGNVNANQYAGGITGFITTGTVSCSTNEGKVSVSQYSVGGIVGRLGTGTVKECTNKDIVESNASSLSYAGGIVGDLNGAGTIKNCTNEGPVYITSVGSNNTYVGGILGNAAANAGIITGNVNTGKVGGDFFTWYAGGIIGYGSSAGVRVENNYNLGELFYWSSNYIGGIAGDLTQASVRNSFSYYLDEEGNAPFGILGTGSAGTVTNSVYLSDSSVAGFKGLAKNADAFKYGEVLYYVNGASQHNTAWKQGDAYPEIAKEEESVSPVYQVKLIPVMAGYEGIETTFYSDSGDKVFEDEAVEAKTVYVTSGTDIEFTITHEIEIIDVEVTGVDLIIEPAKEITGTVKVGSDDIKIMYALKNVDLNIDISWYSDAKESFNLNTLDEFNGFAYLVNNGKNFIGKTITLNNDIDLGVIESWKPIGSETRLFAGTFNGGGKTVSNLKIGDASNPVNSDYQGLFGYNAGAINNLKVTGEIYSTGKYVGGVAGYSTGAIGATTGLVFGDVSDLGEDNKVIAPTSIVTGRDYVGGIVGYSTATIQKSSNYGSVNGASGVGGIAGGSEAAIGGAAATANTNYAPVNAAGDYVGGIVGYHSKNAAVSFNTNYGDIESEGSYVGGIAGAVRGITAAASNTNHGDVTTSGDYVGGVIGSASNGDAQSGTTGAQIATPTNNGEIVGRNYVGGIAGFYRSTSALHTATNNGAVSGDSYVGGIVGAAYGPLGNNGLATNVKNTAEVSGTGDYIGGLGGYLKSADAAARTVSYGYNTASVNGSSTSNCVGGVMGWGDGLVLHTYAADESNKITVTGGTNVGSLAGYIDRSIDINYSYAYANVNGGVGGLVGGVNADAEVTYTNSYYLAEAEDENDANAKIESKFYSGEVAWLLSGGDETRNTTWTQEKDKLPALVANQPVFKVNVSKGIEPEGSTVNITKGPLGVPADTDGEGKQWIYVTSGLKFEITTITPSIESTDVYGISFIDPLDTELVSSTDDGENTTMVYTIGPITANYDGKYVIAIDVKPDYGWYKENPGAVSFTLETEAELKGFAYLVNGLNGQKATNFSGKTIMLSTDINILSGNWTSIGTATAPFQGSFNGNDHKISGLTILATGSNQGLFGYISGNAKVENLKVLNANIIGMGSATGGIAGTAAGSSILSNLAFGAPDDGSAVNGQGQVGGIVGNIAANTVKIQKCTNYGSITGTGNVGGIAGQRAAGTATASYDYITDCVNNGVISGASNVGGIVGQMGNYSKLSGCTNKGYVTGTGNAVGGIMGFAGSGSAAATFDVTNCFNEGVVDGVSNVGGIVGQMGNYSNFSGCENIGDVTGTGNAVGGIVGLAGNGSTAFSNSIVACTNSGKISGVGNVGGVAGQVGNFTNFGNSGDTTGKDASKNTGDVTGAGNAVGGITGLGGSSLKFYRSSNSGTVAGGGDVGGIAGQAGTGILMTGCSNEGDVNAAGIVFAGGIAANIGSGGMVSNSWNIGTITVFTDSWVLGVGGITGTNGASSSYVENSYNIGSIKVVGVSNANVIGGITGIYGTNNSNNYFYKTKVLVGLNEETLAVPAETGDEFGVRRNTSIEEGIAESGELAWLLDKGDTKLRLYSWGQDIDNGRPTVDINKYKPVYRLMVEEAEHGNIMLEYLYISEGSDVILRINSDSGYTIKSLGLKDSTGKYYAPVFSEDNSVATISMPAANLIVSPAFIPLTEIGAGPYTVDFDLNGGSGSSSIAYNQIIQAGHRADKPEDPTRENFTFLGWYDKDIVGEDGSDFLNSDSFDLSTVITKDIELIACWRPSEGAIVTFELNRDANAKGSGQVPMQMVEFGEKIEKPDDPTWESDNEIKSYKFDGWYTADGDVWDFDEILKKENADSGIFVLYAQWETVIDIPNEYEFDDLEGLKDLGISVTGGNPYDGYIFTLGKDITLPADWEGIGGAGKPFNGKFNGNGKTVTLNATVTQPLFHEIGEDGHVYNVNVVGDLAGVSRTSFGCIAGINQGVIDSCTVTLTGSGSIFNDTCGGIVGTNTGGIVSKCTATINIEFNGKYVGGIVGKSTMGYILDCTLTGTSVISGASGGAGEAGIGGIVGRAHLTEIRRCITEDGSKIVMTQISSQMHGGGIVGHYNGTADANFGIISDCVNNADMDMKGSYIGGIVGDMDGGGGKLVYITNCENYGDIDINYLGAGGLIGRATGPNLEIENCHNYGDITNTATGATSTSYGDAGGLIGLIYMQGGAPSVLIIECGNDGTITDYFKNAGGFLGRLRSGESNQTFTIKNSYNAGDVVGSANIGGFIGNAEVPIAITIDNSHVTGDLIRPEIMTYNSPAGEKQNTFTTNVGGLIGTTYSTSLNTISNSSWMGNYMGSKDAIVGGIIGNVATTSGKVEATDVYWAGSFTDIIPETLGGIFGSIDTPMRGVALSNAYWYGNGEISNGVIGKVNNAKKVSVSNSYYRLDERDDSNDNAYGTAMNQYSFASGETAYLLDGGMQDGSNSVRRNQWTQDFENECPVLEKDKSVYMITMSSEGNGSIGIEDRGFVKKEDNKAVYYGINEETIKINVVPEESTETNEFKLKSILVADLSGNEIYSFDIIDDKAEDIKHEFEMPKSNIIVMAEFELQEKFSITPQITGFPDGAIMTIGNAGSGEVCMANKDDVVIVNVSLLSHPEVEGATSAEYFLKSLMVKFGDGSTLDITGSGQFIVSDNAVVIADIGENIVFPEPVEPKEPKDDVGDDDGDGIGDETGAGIGDGTGGGTDTRSDGNHGGTIDTGSEIPVDDGTESKTEDIPDNVNTPQQPQDRVEIIFTETEPEEVSEDEQTPPEPEKEEPEVPEEPEKEEPEEEEAEEASTTPAANEQKSIITPITAAVAAAVLILIGIYRFIILKKKK